MASFAFYCLLSRPGIVCTQRCSVSAAVGLQFGLLLAGFPVLKSRVSCSISVLKSRVHIPFLCKQECRVSCSISVQTEIQFWKQGFMFLFCVQTGIQFWKAGFHVPFLCTNRNSVLKLRVSCSISVQTGIQFWKAGFHALILNKQESSSEKQGFMFQFWTNRNPVLKSRV